MTEHEYENCFKIKAIINPYSVGLTDIHKDVYRFMEIHGGTIALDDNLKPGEYWYYTYADENTIDESAIVEIINETLT